MVIFYLHNKGIVVGENEVKANVNGRLFDRPIDCRSFNLKANLGGGDCRQKTGTAEEAHDLEALADR